MYRVKGDLPSSSRVYGGVIVAIVTLELIISLTGVLILTEGFRQTCISFDLSLASYEIPKSCNIRLQDRDEAYEITRTFTKLVVGLVGGWGCVCVACFLLLACCVRARLCNVQLMCM